MGTFTIYAKTRIQDFTGGSRVSGDYYFLPGVEWISWFKQGGYAIHGTYWHPNFGRPMSRGCINMTNAQAQFIYEWAPPGTQMVISGNTPPS